mmetsp:Transcript_3757/g.5161  ORF Transcript_3757/g.5161 Transcript_3757/m.5161 type:complete len:241 (-) Transcript_3757:158-880(-)
MGRNPGDDPEDRGRRGACGSALQQVQPSVRGLLHQRRQGRARALLQPRERPLRRQRLHSLGGRAVRPEPTRARLGELGERPPLRPRGRPQRRRSLHGTSPLLCHQSRLEAIRRSVLSERTIVHIVEPLLCLFCCLSLSNSLFPPATWTSSAQDQVRVAWPNMSPVITTRTQTSNFNSDPHFVPTRPSKPHSLPTFCCSFGSLSPAWRVLMYVFVCVFALPAITPGQACKFSCLGYPVWQW